MTQITPWQLLVMGGPLMAPIILCSILSLTVVIQKLIQLHGIDAAQEALKQRVFVFLRQNSVKDAIAACDASSLLVAPVFRAGLLRFTAPRHELVAVMEDAARFEVPVIERGLSILSTVAAVLPLLGLLGTVLGLCGVFHTVQVRAAAMNPIMPTDVAGGMGQALIATAASLVAAVPVVIAHHYFTDRVRRVVKDMEKASVRLVDLMTRFGGTEADGKE